MNAALLAVIVKNVRRELATRIAIDACIVDEEVAGNILRQSALNISHSYLDDGRSVLWFQVARSLYHWERVGERDRGPFKKLI